MLRAKQPRRCAAAVCPCRTRARWRREVGRKPRRLPKERLDSPWRRFGQTHGTLPCPQPRRSRSRSRAGTHRQLVPPSQRAFPGSRAGGAQTWPGETPSSVLRDDGAHRAGLSSEHGQADCPPEARVHLQEESRGVPRRPPSWFSAAERAVAARMRELPGASQGAERAVYEKKRLIRKALEGAPLEASAAPLSHRERAVPPHAAPPPAASQMASPSRPSCTRRRRSSRMLWTSRTCRQRRSGRR